MSTLEVVFTLASIFGATVLFGIFLFHIPVNKDKLSAELINVRIKKDVYIYKPTGELFIGPSFDLVNHRSYVTVYEGLGKSIVYVPKYLVKNLGEL